MKKSAAVACGATALMLGLSGCGASFEGSGSKDAASAEQLAMHENDPWDMNIQVDEQKKSDVPLADGVYTGQAPAMAGKVSVTLLVDDNHITCLSTTQDGETQSADIDTISGATITTAGVKQAVTEALSQAEAAAATQAMGN